MPNYLPGQCIDVKEILRKWLDAEQPCTHYVQRLLRSAYNDTAAVTSCSMAESVREVVNCNKLNIVLSVFSYGYTAPTALGINVEQIRANIFYSTF